MSTKKEILRLKAQGHKKNTIAKKLNIDWRTVDRYWDKSENINSPLPLWTKGIEWDSLVTQLESGTMATHLYEELLLDHQLPSYSSFARYLSKIKKKNKSKSIVIRLPKIPGKDLEVDYSGDSISIISPSSGEIMKTELFVGCLPYSSSFFAEFTYSQNLDNFISSHVNMFEHFKGVPLFLIPDNAKVAVDKAHRYDPKLNLTYHDMAEHYGVGISPARVRAPRDKASVERAIGIIQQQFFPRIKDKTYTSLHELNCDLKIWQSEFHNKKLSGRTTSRNDLLKEEEKHLNSLPSIKYQFFHWKSAKIHPDCHFSFNMNYYSVPSRYVGKEILLKYNSKMVMAYFEKDKICSHTILKGHGHYQTNTSHYPEDKIAHYNYSIKHALKESLKIGTFTEAVIKKLIEKGVHPLANLRKVQGIINLAKKYTSDEVEYGCEMALDTNKFFYQYINNCAKNYKYVSKTTDSLLPRRDRKMICLQGGFDNDRSKKTPRNS